MRTLDLRADPTTPIPRPTPPGAGAGPLEAVRAVIADVRARGDAAVFELTERFDGARLSQLAVPEEEIKAAGASCPAALMAALHEAADRIRAFAEHQKIAPWRSEIAGSLLGETVQPLARAGIYVPGGRAAYPSSVLMSAVPAAVAGVPEVALCTPPAADGSVPAPTLAAAQLAGVTEVYRVGGAQAVAAMAFGTESIRPVDVIAGPGNVYVALAKQEVSGIVQIDSVAGPSEIAIVAGPGADPGLIAADLIAQAEHGPLGSFPLITWDPALPAQVDAALEQTLAAIGASHDLLAALDDGCLSVLVAGQGQAIEAAERFAPEHIELIFDGAEEAAATLRNAGAIFVGRWSPVSLGDYLAGSNHVLPTAASARFASGLRTSHFQRASAVIVATEASLAASREHLRVFAEAERLPNHARAVDARFRHNGGPE
ncbi:MAG TPA: histidinol dehydrogenase [Actinomycetota bacterium]|nr:histidinol dehydrogenase [Actinomycetota bacterium]